MGGISPVDVAPSIPRNPGGYGRWLVAGLTFQLAADIIGTSIAPSWQEVGQLGAIAVIRTFLNFFLERDLAELGDSGRTTRDSETAA